MIVTQTDSVGWWKTYDVPANRWVGWQIGPLHLRARHSAAEWSFRWRRESDALTAAAGFSDDLRDEPGAADEESARYTLEHRSGQLSLNPLLADLPVIVRPAIPLFIPSRHKTELYVSTVLWLRVSNDSTVLLEMPIFRPSDTWFGATTTQGELCYASRTQARTRIETLVDLPHRAVTPVVIVNEASTPLQIQQLRVPVPFLSLYAGQDGRLWTDRIRLTRAADSTEASLELLGGEALPAGCTRLAEPREDAPRQSLVRSFSRLFD
jgi:hypothetical protein